MNSLNDLATAELGAARARQRTDRAVASRSAQPPPRISKDVALEELRRYAALYPTTPPEVAAVGLFRRADDWDEIRAVEAALDELLKGGFE